MLTSRRNERTCMKVDFRNMTKHQIAEESLVDLAFAILTEKHSSMSLEVLTGELQKIKGYTNAEMKARIQQFYTDLNIDGRFLLNQEDGWGLREWYKVEQIEEETAPSVKIRKKKSKAAKEDDFDDVEELEAEEALIFEDELEDEEDDEDEEESLVDPVGFGKDEEELEDEEEIDEEEVVEEVIIEDEEFDLGEEDEEEDEEDEE